MRIVVCMKEVPAQSGARRLDPVSYRLVRTLGSELNGADYHALEAALQMRDAGRDVEIVLVSMGPRSVIGSLQHALAMGADRAAVVADEAVAGSDLVATSRVLARVIERESPDLVLFGTQSSDSNGSLLWAAVADRMRLPFVSNATQVTAREDAALEATRQTELGFEKVFVPQPCVVSLSGTAAMPRFPSLKGMIAAKRKMLAVLSVGELGLPETSCGSAGSMTSVLDLLPPPPRQHAVMVEDEKTAPERILEFLVERRLL